MDEVWLVRLIYPRNGYNEVCYDTLLPWGGSGSYHHYIYRNVTKTRSDYDTPYKYMTVLGGAWVQFLPGEGITCSHDSVYIYGRSRRSDIGRHPPDGGLRIHSLLVNIDGRLHPDLLTCRNICRAR